MDQVFAIIALLASVVPSFPEMVRPRIIVACVKGVSGQH